MEKQEKPKYERLFGILFKSQKTAECMLHPFIFLFEIEKIIIMFVCVCESNWDVSWPS